MSERDIGGPQSIGAYRVGTNFNPSGSDDVNRLKEHAAKFIDECQRQWAAICEREREHERADAGPGASAVHEATTLGPSRFREQAVCFDRAMREAESAAMWAVKAATKRDPS